MMITCCQIILVVGMLLLTCTTTTTTAAQHKREKIPPNIVHILIDDWGYNDVPFRDSNIDAPNMKKLTAEEGVVIEHFYMTPLCTPSRAALATGRMPWRYGMQDFKPDVNNPQIIPLNETFLSERLLKSNLYRTASIGKWDLGLVTPQHLPKNRGFGDPDFQLGDTFPSQVWGGGCNQANFAITSKELIEHLGGFQGYFKSSYGLLAKGYSINYLWDIHSSSAKHCISPGSGVDIGCTNNYKVLNETGANWHASYSTDVFGKAALEYIRIHKKMIGIEKDRDIVPKSLYLYLAMTTTHAGVQSLPSDSICADCKCKDYPIPNQRATEEQLKQADMKCPDNYIMGKNSYENVWPGPSCNSGKVKRVVQCGAIRGIDRVVGTIVKEMKGNGMYENAIFLVSGDNGGEIKDASSNWPLQGGKGSGWEGGVRTPAFMFGGRLQKDMAAKGIKKPGYTFNGIFTVVDVTATWVELAGLNDDGILRDGVSQWSSITGRTASAARSQAVVVMGTDSLGSLQMALWQNPTTGKTWKLLRNPTAWLLYGVSIVVQTCVSDLATEKAIKSKTGCLDFVSCMYRAVKELTDHKEMEDDSKANENIGTNVDASTARTARTTNGSNKDKKITFLDRITGSSDAPAGMVSRAAKKLGKMVKLAWNVFKQTIDKDGGFCVDLDTSRRAVCTANVDGSLRAAAAATNASAELFRRISRAYQDINDEWFLLDITTFPKECDDVRCKENVYEAADAGTSSEEAQLALLQLRKMFNKAKDDSVVSGYNAFSDSWANRMFTEAEFVTPFRDEHGNAFLWNGSNLASDDDRCEPPKQLRDVIRSFTPIWVTVFSLLLVLIVHRFWS